MNRSGRKQSSCQEYLLFWTGSKLEEQLQRETGSERENKKWTMKRSSLESKERQTDRIKD
jgi:hypothetical protein